jgi:hypothetical protein
MIAMRSSQHINDLQTSRTSQCVTENAHIQQQLPGEMDRFWQNINEMLSTSQCSFRLSDEIDSRHVFDLFYQAHKFSKTYTPD